MQPTISTLPAALVEEAATHVYRLFKEQLPAGITYHTYRHTVEVVTLAEKIGRSMEIPDAEMHPLLVAAWFHDTGFCHTTTDHEEASVRIAVGFLEAFEVDDATIALVARLIRATRAGHAPADRLEAVMRDADLTHLEGKQFYERGDALRQEWAATDGRVYSDQQWLELQHDWLRTVEFATPYARKRLGPSRAKHLRKLERMLAGELDLRHQLERQGAEGARVEVGGLHFTERVLSAGKASALIGADALIVTVLLGFSALGVVAPGLRWSLVAILGAAVASALLAIWSIWPRRIQARAGEIPGPPRPAERNALRAALLVLGAGLLFGAGGALAVLAGPL